MYDMYPDYGTQEWGPAHHRDEAAKATARAMQVAFDRRDDDDERPDDN